MVGDSNNEPLIGATVKVKGTNIVTVTDMDGNFELEVPSGAELVVSYIGFNDQTVRLVALRVSTMLSCRRIPTAWTSLW